MKNDENLWKSQSKSTAEARLHGLDPQEVLLPVRPRENEELLRTEDVLAAIEGAGDSLAVLCFGTVQCPQGWSMVGA